MIGAGSDADPDRGACASDSACAMRLPVADMPGGRPCGSPSKGRSHRDSSRAAIFLFLSNRNPPVLGLDGQPPLFHHVLVAELVAQSALEPLGELVNILDRQAEEARDLARRRARERQLHI